MNEEIEEILRELQEACQKVAVLRDMYQIGKDYFAEDNSRKINEFNATFDARKERIETSINSFVRFIEKSFAPSEEEIARKMAEEKLRSELPGFDEWDENVKKSLIEREMKNIVVAEPQKRERRERSETGTKTGRSIDNPEPQRAYAITDDFSFCKPSLVELRGERHEVSSWRNLLIVIGQQLFNSDENPLRLHIENNPNRRMFTYSNNFHLPTEVANGIYTEGHGSTDAMIMRVQKLLDIYSVAYSEVRVYLSKVAAE